MTARRARLWRCLRPLVKPLLGAFLALVGVLAPIESPDLAPFDDLVGAPRASAQATVVPGTPDGCADPSDTRWVEDTADPSRCVLDTPQCGEHPLIPGTYLTPSTEFPDFCEVTVLESADASMYAACVDIPGYVTHETITLTDKECRIIAPSQCSPGQHRVEFDTCLRVRRQTWSCPADTFPRNQYNSCYDPPATTASNLACATSAPDFPIETCEEYVGEDYVRNPADPTLACGTAFPTGDPSSALQDHTANQYWCRYDTSFLNVDCHATGATCTASYAYCIKRASRTGGCDVVADTIRCRGWQADYLDTSLTVSADDVFQQGCTPCVVLPFESVSAQCAGTGTLHQEPSRASNLRIEWAHTYKVDFYESDRLCVHQAHVTGTMTNFCRQRVRCTDPPHGRLVWDSSHHSGFAIVNSPIILHVVDVPDTEQAVHLLQPMSRASIIMLRTITQYVHSDTSLADPIIRTWTGADPTRDYDTVDHITYFGECVVRARPEFRIIVEELWPDQDEAAIEDLFGPSALDWWTPLGSAARQQHTEARGFQYVVGMSSTDLDSELERRASLNEEIRCNYGTNTWCRWTPSRSGYYRLTAAGGWYLQGYFGRRHWRPNTHVQSLERFLQNTVTAGNDDCPFSEGQRLSRGRDYDCIMDYLQNTMLMTPQEAGLAHDPITKTFTGLLRPHPPQSNEWLYSDAAGENYRCPPRDIRVSCGSGINGINYTQSAPIGILIHEVRVGTVMPS